MKDVKVEGLFRDVKYPIELFDKNGNKIYYEGSSGFCRISEYDKNNNEIYFKDSDGYSWVSEFDENGNLLYSKDSDGLIRDNRPKKKYTVRELEKLIGIDNIEIVKE